MGQNGIIPSSLNKKVSFKKNCNQIEDKFKIFEIKQVMMKRSWDISKKFFQYQKRMVNIESNNGKKYSIAFKLYLMFNNWTSVITIVNLVANNEPGIIKDILHIPFRNLVTILLSGNYICSLESLIFLDAKNLQNIHADWNFISNIDILFKFNLKNLTKLNFNFNPILNFNKINRLKGDKITSFIFESEENSFETIPDLIIKLAKIESKKLFNVEIKSKSRIKSNNTLVIKSLKKRLYNLVVKRHFQ